MCIKLIILKPNGENGIVKKIVLRQISNYW